MKRKIKRKLIKFGQMMVIAGGISIGLIILASIMAYALMKSEMFFVLMLFIPVIGIISLILILSYWIAKEYIW